MADFSDGGSQLSFDSDEIYQVQTKSRSRSLLLPGLLILALVVVTAWLFLGKEDNNIQAENNSAIPRQQMPQTENTAAPQVSSPTENTPEISAETGLSSTLPDAMPTDNAADIDDIMSSTDETGLIQTLIPDTKDNQLSLGAPITRGILSSDPNQPLPPELASRGDSVVRPTFIDDLAKWLVAGYTPPSSRNGRGSVSVGIKSANSRYGVSMKGLSWVGEDLSAGRNAVLSYAYTPDMLEVLYRMYSERFLEAITDAAQQARYNGKALEPTQIAEMYTLYARRFRSLAGAMQSIASLSDLRQRTEKIHRAATSMLEANNRYLEEVFAFDQARAGKNEAEIAKTQQRMEAASEAWQQASSERNRLREELIAAIRVNPQARSFGDDNLLYLAMWIDRRLEKSQLALEASSHAAKLLTDMARRFEGEAGVLQ